MVALPWRVYEIYTSTSILKLYLLLYKPIFLSLICRNNSLNKTQVIIISHSLSIMITETNMIQPENFQNNAS